MLHDHADYETALREVEAMAGCLEQTPEESVLIELLLAIAIYETRTGGRRQPVRP